MVGWFFEVYRRRGLKFHAGKRKVMTLNGEEVLECEVHVDGIRLENVSKVKYLEYVLDEAGTDGAECSRKVTRGRRVSGAIRSLVNARNLQLECARVMNETLIVPVLTSWDEKERSRISAVQIDNLRGLLSIKRMDRVSNARIRELWGLTKGIDERIDDGLFRWFDHVERMKKDRTAKRVYVGECAGSRSVGRPRKRWTDTVKESFKKGGLVFRQRNRMVQERSEWLGFVRRSAWGIALG